MSPTCGSAVRTSVTSTYGVHYGPDTAHGDVSALRQCGARGHTAVKGGRPDEEVPISSRGRLRHDHRRWRNHGAGTRADTDTDTSTNANTGADPGSDAPDTRADTGTDPESASNRYHSAGSSHSAC